MLVVHPSADLYGADRVLVESATGLRAAGADVTVVLPNDGPLLGKLDELGVHAIVLDVPVLRKSLLRPRGFLSLAATAVRSAPRLAHAIRGADVVYANTVTLPAVLALAKILRAPTVCHVHEAEEMASPLLQRALVAPLLLADRVIANSACTSTWLTNTLPRLGAKTIVIHNGVRGPATVTPARTVIEGAARLVLVGRLSQRKGGDLAIAATKHLRDMGYDVELTLVGDVFPGYEAFEAELRGQVSDDGSVTFAGFSADVWPAFERCDIALVCSRTESFGNVAVEAMLAQRPLVAVAIQGLKEVVDPAYSQVVAPEDAKALAQGVARLLDDWSSARQRAVRAQEQAVARFSPARFRHDIANAVTSLVGV